MNVDNGALEFDAYINNERLNATALEAERRIKGLTSTVESESQKMDQSFSNIGKYVAGYFGVQAMTGFVTQLTKVRGEFQQLDVAFTTMLGSKEKSDALMAQIVDTAARTPFTLTQVAAGAKQLLAYQVAAEDVNDTIIRLGNIASGLGTPIERITALYGKAKSSGKLMGDDLNQFSEAGIPIHEFAKVLGIADDKVRKFVEDGKVGFPEVQKVIQNLTNEGGMFYNLMEKQSKTLTGQISNLQDAWDKMLNSIGQSNEGLLSGAIEGATYLVGHYQEVLDVIVPLIATYGTYRAALLVFNVAKAAELGLSATEIALNIGKVSSIALLTEAKQAETVATIQAATAQRALNASVLANPYVLAAAALVGLTVVIYKLVTATTVFEQAQKELTQSVESENVSLEIMFDRLKNATKGTEEYANAKKAIIDKYGQYDEMLKTELETLEGQKIAYDKLTEAILNSAKAKLKTKYTNEAADKSAEEQAKLYGRLSDRLDDVFGKLEGGKLYNKLRNAVSDGSDVGTLIREAQASSGKSIKVYQFNAIERIVENIKESKLKLKGEIAEFDKIFGDITDDKNQNKANDKNSAKLKTVREQIEENLKAQKEANDELKKMRSSDSTSTSTDIDAQLKKIEDLKKQYETLTGISKKATAKAAKEENNALKEFEDEKIKMQNKYGEMQIDLQKDISKRDLEAKSKNITDSRELDRIKLEEQKNIIDLQLKETIAGINEMERVYKEKATKAKIKNPDLSIFQNMRDTATTQSNTNKETLDLELQKKYLDDVLSKYKNYQQQMLDLERSYNNDMTVLNKALNDAKSESEKEQIRNSIEQRKKAFTDAKNDINVKELMDSTDWKYLFNNLETLSVEKMIQIRNRLEEEWAKLNLPPDQLKALRDQLDKVYAKIKEKNPFAALKDSFDRYQSASAKKDFLVSNSSNMKDVGIDPTKAIETSTADASAASTADASAAFSDFAGSAIASTKLVEEQLSQVFDAMDSLGVEGMDEAKKMAKDITGMVQDAATLATGIVTGNPVQIIQGAIGLLTKGIKFIAEQHDNVLQKDIEKHQKSIKKLKTTYEDLERAVNKALGSDKWKIQTQEVDNLQKQMEDISKMADDERKKKKKDKDKLEDYDNQLKDSKNKIDDIIESMKNSMLGTDIASIAQSLGDALFEAFAQGTNAAEAWGKKVDEIVKNIVKNLIIQSVVMPQVDAIVKKYTSKWVNEEGKIVASTQQITSDTKQMGTELKGLEPTLENMIKNIDSSIGKSSNSSSNSLTGAVQSSVTEETATLLAGYINAIRINQSSSLAKMDSVLLKLDVIATNTAYLVSIDKNISKLSTDNLRTLG